MNILVFGLGALGTVFAAALKSAGHTVYGILKKKYIENIPNGTVKITGFFGNKEAKLDGLWANTERLRNSIELDLIILSVKAYDTTQAVHQLKDLVRKNTLLLLAQNGYGNYEIASSMLPDERIILSRIIFGAKLKKAGWAEVTVFGDDIVIGHPAGKIPKGRLHEVSRTLSMAGLPTRVSDQIYRILWDKIIFNSALNPLGALLGCSYGALAACEETRFLIDEIVKEIFEVTNAKGIKLNWPCPEAYLKHFYESLIPRTGKHLPSMYYDLKLGKRTEIDALNGAVVRLAREVGFPVPVNDMITRLIRAKEKLSWESPYEGLR